MPVFWTEEMDTVLRDGCKQGLSARIIAEQLAVTRNAVLGRTFRLGLCQSYDNPRQPAVVASKPKKTKETLLRRSLKLDAKPTDLIERLKDLIDLDLTWNEIAARLGVSTPTARQWAISYAGYKPKKLRRFTDSDRAYICEAWQRNDHIEDIADKLGRSWGVIHQEIFRLQKLGVIGGRDRAKTRLLRKYGADALAAGDTPSEALRKISQAKQAAFAQAVNSAREAKNRFKTRALEEMRTKLANGEDRDTCIFAARAEGVTLEEIGAEFGITRERVRQICNAYASNMALQAIVNRAGAQPAE